MKANIIAQEITEHTISKEGPNKGRRYIFLIDRNMGKKWFVSDNKLCNMVRKNGIGTEYEVEYETTDKGTKVNNLTFIRVHDKDNTTFTEKDKNASIKESVAIKEVGDNVRAGIKVNKKVIKAYNTWIEKQLGITNETTPVDN